MNETIKNQYLLWQKHAVSDVDVVNELKAIQDSEKEIEDAFYRDLEFGTGGLRGVIGAGTNRMNVHTVAKASQGLANYIKKSFSEGDRSIAVSFDSRIKSELFAKISSQVFAANGIQVHMYKTLMPTPCLSYAVRKLQCSAGIMITASHNPAKYNGYKVYGDDGCQITTNVAEQILSEIVKVDVFNDVQSIDFKKGIGLGKIQFIDDTIYSDFVNEVQNQSVLLDTDNVDKNLAIVYTPLNGAGLKPVLRTLNESGFTNITVVKEQELPDGNFPTCSYPNPEVKEAMSLGIKYAKECNADLLIATDPDCDRVGVAIKNLVGDFVILSGNEIGILLFDFICAKKTKDKVMPVNPILVKTIVTTEIARKIAFKYGVKTVDVLTGFKFIGEQIGCLEKEGKEKSYIFGFEESCGYLSGTYVRDKDAVNATFLICEMFAYYKANKVSLIDKLESIYIEHGYCLNTLHSFDFEGAEGFNKMQLIMQNLRLLNSDLLGMQIVCKKDYLDGIDNLPKSNVLKFELENNISVIIRPSGTEPKLKIYVSVINKNKERGATMEKSIMKIFNSIIYVEYKN